MYSVNRNYSRNKYRGFTLAETIVTTALFGLIMIAVTTAIHNIYRYNAYTFAQAYQVQNARIGLQSLVRDIREMTFADDGSFPLVIMESDKIGFYSDIDRDDSVEYVEYELIDPTIVTKSVFNATGSPPTYNTSAADDVYTLSRYVQNVVQSLPVFKYYDSNGTELVSSDDILDVRYVEVEIIVNIDPIRDPGQYQLRSSAALRNVKDNL